VISLVEIMSERRTKFVEYNGHKIRVVYNPGVMTLDFAERASTGSNNAVVMVDSLADLLVEWDVCDAEGKQIEPTREVLAKINLMFLAHVMGAITSDDVVGEAPGGTFDAG
jgi:hypothetical protein